MANVQTDFAVGNGTFVARATDADGNAAVTVTLADPGTAGGIESMEYTQVAPEEPPRLMQILLCD